MVLRRSGQEIDFLIHHADLPDTQGSDRKPDAKTLFGIALAADRQLADHYRALNALVREETGRDDIALAITEYGGRFTPEQPTPYLSSLGNALVTAELLRVLMQPEHRIVVANHRQFANEEWGW